MNQKKLSVAFGIMMFSMTVILFQNCEKKDTTYQGASTTAPNTGGGATDTTSTAVMAAKEYQVVAEDKYFFLTSPSEQTQTEALGKFKITGNTYFFYASPADDRVAVYRFFLVSTKSHLYVFKNSDLVILRADPSKFEEDGIQGYAMTTINNDDTTCPSGLRPMYRLFSANTAPTNLRHRFTTDSAIRAQLKSAGWTDEKVAFCLP